MAIEQTDMNIQTQFGKLNLKNFAEGMQAQCVRLNSWEDYQAPVIMKLAGEGRNYTPEEIGMLHRETIAYRQELIDANVKIPNNFVLTPFINGSENQIQMVDEFLGSGQDVKQELKDTSYAQENGDYLVGLMVKFLHDLPDGDKPFRTKVMGDFKPANFVAEDGDLIFIDYFGPKRVGDDGQVFPYLSRIEILSRDAITFLCGDRRGQITRLLALIKREHPSYLSTALDEVDKLYTDMPEVLTFAKEQTIQNFSGISDIYQNREWSTQI